jgi:ankyrin repeat protein
MPIRELPARPNLEHLKNQAHTLQRERLADNADASARFAATGITTPEPKLADALHTIAREYGFDTWPALKLHIELMSEDPVQALIAALKSKDASLVRQVLTRHPSLKEIINEPLPNYGFDAPALLAAVEQQDRAMVDALLDAGANMNERSRWWAGSYGVLDTANPELAAYLIARGAVVDIHSAVRLGMIDRVRQFLDQDASLIHARGGDGQLPLHFATTIEMAALLLERGAHIDARDIDHESTAVQYMVSIRPHRHDVARYLVAHGAQADILAASALGDLEAIHKLLAHDPDLIRMQVAEKYFPKQDPRAGGVIYIYGFGWTATPHMVAHQFGHAEAFELLMQRSSPWLRLAHACDIHDEALVRQLIADHPRLIENLSPLAARRIIGAALRNNTRAVELLLSAGWPATPVNDRNQTTLHHAAWHGNLAMVKALLAGNAPVNVFETQYGGSPLAWALHGSLNSWERKSGDYPGVTRALLAAGAEIPRPEQRTNEAADEVLAIILQQGK